MGSLLQHIINFVDKEPSEISFSKSGSSNRMNSMGDYLEEYVKYTIADIQKKDDEASIVSKIEKAFSYFGNANNIPDAILKNGDAIEIKKIQSYKADLALNSSPPKDVLYSSDSRLNKDARAVDGGEWESKNIYYVVGYVCKKKSKLSSLLFLDGALYAANKETYASLAEAISSAVTSCEGVEFQKTNELGKVHKVDPLGRTMLRVRGMWHIAGPFDVFEKYIRFEEGKYNFTVLVSLDKYKELDEEYREKLEKHSGIEIKYIKVPNPNNGAQFIDVVCMEKI